jgi:hypothetical protein
MLERNFARPFAALDLKAGNLGKIRKDSSSDIKSIGQEERVLREFLRKKDAFFGASRLRLRIGKIRVLSVFLTLVKRQKRSERSIRARFFF